METSVRYGGESSGLRISNNNSPSRVKYAGDVSSIKIHAKQKIQFDSDTLLQLNGELDTRTGAPTFLCALVRHFYPNLSASVGAGLHYDRNDKLVCTLRGKKAYPVASNRFVKVHLKGRCDIDKELNQLSASVGAGLHYDRNDKLVCTLRGKKAYPVASNRFVKVHLKGRCDIDKELNQPTPHGALELVWNILDFQKDQDVRLKVGYEIFDKIPYVQIRENNWTFNADINGRWNVLMGEMRVSLPANPFVEQNGS